MHPTGHFWVNFFVIFLDISYWHIYIYLGHPLKLNGVWAYIILGDFTGATPICTLIIQGFMTCSTLSPNPWAFFFVNKWDWSLCSWFLCICVIYFLLNHRCVFFSSPSPYNNVGQQHKPAIPCLKQFWHEFLAGSYQLVDWLPIGSWFANHNDMVIWPC